MQTMSSSYIITLFIFSLTLLFLFLASDATNLINQTCKNSSNTDPENIPYEFCVHALQSVPASHCANITQLGLISLTLIKHNITNTTFLINQLLQDHKVDTNTKSGLEDCLELYSDSIPTLSEAIRDYSKNRFADVNVKISSVMDASTTCEDGFNDAGVASPLTLQNNCCFQLSAISLSIIKLISSS